MESQETGDRPVEPSTMVNTVEHVKEKRVVKLTAKAFADKLERLQNERKTNLNKAGKFRDVLHGLMMKKDRSQVESVFNDYVKLCNDTKGVHESVMSMLPDTEQEKHDVWFKAKMIVNDDCISKVQLWLANAG